ncbi:MAG: hypothetical protein CEE43_00515 [Promethearchaeota archaeon Loki_b32]|nr:MAG: hypothetical protein CEE43_00515 [Candidatus Lokiarchaeota archaeon Loki_b32]
MPDFENIMKNNELSEVTANFFVLYKDEETWFNGWVSLEPSLEEFISTIRDEIEYSWDLENIDIEDYLIFHIDIEDKNNMKEIKEDQYYQWVMQFEEIFIVVLHKDIKYRIIENIPPVFEWFMGTI